MKNKTRPTDTRTIPAFTDNKCRFVRTKHGEQYCVEWLLITQGKLMELVCYRFDEFGTRIGVRLKPADLQDLSEISELLDPNVHAGDFDEVTTSGSTNSLSLC